jgi:hypothetical protein
MDLASYVKRRVWGLEARTPVAETTPIVPEKHIARSVDGLLEAAPVPPSLRTGLLAHIKGTPRE